MKKIIALLLAVMMLVTLVACTKAPADTTTKAPVSGNDATEGKTDNTEAGSDEKEIVTVKWVTTNDQPGNYESWVNTVNAYAADKIGVNVEMVHVDQETMRLMVQTGADWDIVFAPGGEFTMCIEYGAAAPLEDLMVNVPGLTDLIPQYVFDAVTVDGHLYGIPAYKDVSHSEYFIWDKEMVDTYYPEYTEVHDLKGAYEALKTMKERGCPWLGWQTSSSFNFNGALTWNYDTCEIGAPVGINFNGGTEFVSIWEQPDVLENLSYAEKLYHEGYVNNDSYIVDSVMGNEFVLGQGWGWPSAKLTAWPRDGRPVEVSQYYYTTVSTGSCRGSILVLNKASTKLVEALKWIELVNTDTWVRDMYWHGEEGVQWEYTEVDGVKKIQKIETDVSWTYWAYMYGTFFTATEEVNGTPWGEIKTLNESAVASPAMGFTFDKTPVADQIAAVSAAWEPYVSMVEYGVDISQLDLALEDMYACGLQDIIDEANRQYQDWLASK